MVIEVSVIFGLVAMFVSIITLFMNYRKGFKSETKDDTTIVVELKTDLKYTKEKLGDITNQLTRIENKFEETSLAITTHEIEIKTIYKHLDSFRNRILTLERKVGIEHNETSN